MRGAQEVGARASQVAALRAADKKGAQREFAFAAPCCKGLRHIYGPLLPEKFVHNQVANPVTKRMADRTKVHFDDARRCR